MSGGWPTNRNGAGSGSGSSSSSSGGPTPNNNNNAASFTSTESGILRKARAVAPHVVEPHHLDDLLVFGYACKIFRDDARATQIDHGKHLIPWMGDASLKIDRYDVRATMSDIAAHEAPAAYADQLATLTPAERRAEQLCEQERYHSLYNNDVEEEMYKDEALKRLHRERSATYGQVPFDYAARAPDAQPSEHGDGAASGMDVPEDAAGELEEPFVVNVRFYVPPTIATPDTMKLHAVIEKTAMFIAAQGPQMEILIKAKQSNNQQFEFLNVNNRLNAYYKHVLNALKNGYYPVEEPEPTDDPNAPTTTAESAQTPPIDISSNPPPMIVVPQIKYKPSADCAYTQLISKIKGAAPIAETTSANHNANEIDGGARDSPDSFSREATLKHIKDFEQFQKNQATDAAKLTKSNPAQLTKEQTTKTADNSAASRSTKAPPTNGNSNNHNKTAAKVEVKKISSALMLAQCYNSDSEDEDTEHTDNDETTASADHAIPTLPLAATTTLPADLPIPPAELQNIIDKTAAYVLKNGKEFEEILRTKNDPRFAFLTYTDPYNRYYVCKVTGATVCSVATETSAPPPPGVESETTVTASKDPPKSISFSIKVKEETTPLLSQRTVLPQEMSSDDEDQEAKHKTPTNDLTVPTALGSPPASTLAALLPTPVNVKVLLPTPSLTSATSPHIVKDSITVPAGASAPQSETIAIGDCSRNDPQSSQSSNGDSSHANSLVCEVKLRDALLDASDFTTVTTTTSTTPTVGQRSDARRCTDALKDRLAQAARDKLGAVSREKQLQLERRKKAMAFLIQMKTDTVPAVSSDSNPPTVRTATATPVALVPSAKTTDVKADVIVVDGAEEAKRNGNCNASRSPAIQQQSDTASVHSVHSSPASSVVVVLNGGVVSDDDDDSTSRSASTSSPSPSPAVTQPNRRKRRKHRSRSRSRSPSTTTTDRRRHKRKKSKHHRAEHHHSTKRSHTSKSTAADANSRSRSRSSRSARSKSSRHDRTRRPSTRSRSGSRSSTASSRRRQRRDRSRSQTSRRRHKSSRRREASS